MICVENRLLSEKGKIKTCFILPFHSFAVSLTCVEDWLHSEKAKLKLVLFCLSTRLLYLCK